MTTPTVRKLIEDALQAGPIESRTWELWTSNSWRRIPGVIEPIIQRHDSHPDLHATLETLNYVVAVQPANILALLAAHDAELAAARAEVERLRAALQGFIRNSTCADWPDDIYDAVETALTQGETK